MILLVILITSIFWIPLSIFVNWLDKGHDELDYCHTMTLEVCSDVIMTCCDVIMTCCDVIITFSDVIMMCCGVIMTCSSAASYKKGVFEYLATF